VGLQKEKPVNCIYIFALPIFVVKSDFKILTKTFFNRYQIVRILNDFILLPGKMMS